MPAIMIFKIQFIIQKVLFILMIEDLIYFSED